MQRLKLCPISVLGLGVSRENLNPSPSNILATEHLNENISLFDWSRRVYLAMARRSATAALIDQEVKKILFYFHEVNKS